ncbi:MAG: hypothetical protein ACTSR3_01290 [Candidatus Helarchaeota archaeon]
MELIIHIKEKTPSGINVAYQKVIKDKDIPHFIYALSHPQNAENHYYLSMLGFQLDVEYHNILGMLRYIQ